MGGAAPKGISVRRGGPRIVHPFHPGIHGKDGIGGRARVLGTVSIVRRRGRRSFEQLWSPEIAISPPPGMDLAQ